MNTLKEITVSLIFCSVAIGLCELLVPKESFKNQMRLITGCVFLICILSPFVNGIELPEYDFSDLNTEFDITESAERSVAFAAKNEISELLKEYNIENASISITTGLDKNNSIILESVIILFDEKDKSVSEKIIRQAEDKLNLKVQAGEL